MLDGRVYVHRDCEAHCPCPSGRSHLIIFHGGQRKKEEMPKFGPLTVTVPQHRRAAGQWALQMWKCLPLGAEDKDS